MSVSRATSFVPSLSPIPPTPPPKSPSFKNPPQHPQRASSQMANELPDSPRNNPLPPSPLHIPPRALLPPISSGSSSSSRLVDPHPRTIQNPHSRRDTQFPRAAQVQEPAASSPSPAALSQAAASFYAHPIQEHINKKSSSRFPVNPPSNKQAAQPPQQSPPQSSSKFSGKFDTIPLEEQSTLSSKSSSSLSKKAPSAPRSLKTLGGHFQKRDFQLYDPESGPKMLSRGWRSAVPGEHTRRARMVGMGVGVVGVAAFVVVGLAASGVL